MLGPLAASRALATCLRFVVSTLHIHVYSSGSSTCINDRADLDDCELYTYGPNKTQPSTPKNTQKLLIGTPRSKKISDPGPGHVTLGAYVTVMVGVPTW